MNSKKLLLGVTALGSWLLAGTAFADAADAFNVAVSYSWLHDNNIYRLADDVDIGSPRSDTVRTLGVSLIFDKAISRQRFHAEANLQDARYQEHKLLDNRPYDTSLSWYWVLGNNLSGTLRQMNTRNMSSFENYQQTLKNIYTTHTSLATVRLQVHPDWFVEGSVQDYRAKQSYYTTSNVEVRETKTGILHRRPNGDEFRLRWTYRDGEYPNQVHATSYDFRESQFDALMTMVFTGASSVEASFGHLRRHSPFRPARDYSGQVGRLAWNWMPTGKLSLTTAIERKIGPKDDLLSTFALTDTVSLSAVWAVSGKVQFMANASKWRSDFRGDPGIVVPGAAPRRQDDGSTLSLGVSYEVMRNLLASLQVSSSRRDTAHSDFWYYSRIPFRDRTVWASIRWTF